MRDLTCDVNIVRDRDMRHIQGGPIKSKPLLHYH